MTYIYEANLQSYGQFIKSLYVLKVYALLGQPIFQKNHVINVKVGQIAPGGLWFMKLGRFGLSVLLSDNTPNSKLAKMAKMAKTSLQRSIFSKPSKNGDVNSFLWLIPSKFIKLISNHIGHIMYLLKTSKKPKIARIPVFNHIFQKHFFKNEPNFCMRPNFLLVAKFRSWASHLVSYASFLKSFGAVKGSEIGANVKKCIFWGQIGPKTCQASLLLSCIEVKFC